MGVMVTGTLLTVEALSRGIADVTVTARDDRAAEVRQVVEVLGCVRVPDGALHWWTGDGTGADIVGGLDVTLMNGADCAKGSVLGHGVGETAAGLRAQRGGHRQGAPPGGVVGAGHARRPVERVHQGPEPAGQANPRTEARRERVGAPGHDPGRRPARSSTLTRRSREPAAPGAST